MAAAGQSTWDGNPNLSPPVTTPYRPGTADFNNLALQDDQEDPPGDPTLPSAALMNGQSGAIVAMARVVANAIVSIIFSGGPQFDSATATPTNVVSNPISSTFTVVRTPGGSMAGDIFIYWPASALPAAQLTRPKGYLNGATPGSICVDRFTNGGNTGVRVVTYNTSASPADLPFTVEIM